jgi:polar amino acid transport system permease protein
MRFSDVIDSWSTLVHGLLGTVELSIAAIVLATLLGLLIALARTGGWIPLRILGRAYVELFRGSPLLIQMLFVYFGAASLGFPFVSVLAAAVLALTLYEAAYIAEIFRAGIQSVPTAQVEAAKVLGLSRRDTFLHVVLPQAMRVSRAPLAGQYIALIKDSSLAIAIGFAELLRQGQAIVDRVGQPIEVYLTVAALYFAICYPLSLLVRRIERKAPVAA